MNEIHSNKKYLHRWLEPILQRAIQEDPVVVVTGARQVGKSTLLQHTLPEWRFLSLDDFDILTQAEQDPLALLADPRPLVIDEVQRVPTLLTAVKQIVDQDRHRRRFVLSGSANLLLIQKVTEHLAGRASFLHLEPFTLGESAQKAPQSLINSLLKGQAPTASQATADHSWKETIWQGGFPIVNLERRGPSVTRWFEGYVSSYLERDLRQLAQVDSLTDFRRLMKAVALRSGALLNQTEISRDINLPQPTIHRYLNLLEASHLFYRLTPYSVNRTKRLIKTPKPYLADSGLVAFLAGYSIPPAETDPFWGPLLETTVYHQLRVWCDLQTPKGELFYWRTTTNNEVDFVISSGRQLIAIEVKSTQKPRYAHADHLRLFLSEYPEAQAGLVIHLGGDLIQLDQKIFAVPLSTVV